MSEKQTPAPNENPIDRPIAPAAAELTDHAARRSRLDRLRAFFLKPRRLPRRAKKALGIGLALLAAGAAIVSAANAYVIHATQSRVYTRAADVPARDVALVLGASIVSYHCGNRLKAAAELYQAGKVRHLLVSGDNHVKSYDEPTAMKAALIAMGVPERDITCDYAGFRTLDSVVRARRIFGQDRLVIVSQQFHLYRALLIARRQGINAVGYCAEEAPAGYRERPRVREVAARTVALLDLYVLNRQPRFLGRHETIDLAAR